LFPRLLDGTSVDERTSASRPAPVSPAGAGRLTSELHHGSPLACEAGGLTAVLTGAADLDAGRRQDGLALVRRARRDPGARHVPTHLLATGALVEHRAALALGQDMPAQQLLAWTRDQLGDVAELDLMQAVTSLHHGALDAAAVAVRHVLDGVRPALRPTTRLDATLLRTELEMRLGRRTRARGALNAALVMAEPAALIEPFHQAGGAVRQLLLEQVGGFGPGNAFAARVSRALSTVDVKRVEPLTGREQAVLVRLSTTQSLDEVASAMSVSVNTVKTHVRAIYAKLGVNNRREAVVAGRRYGLN
jgi:LuxR family maltose regulon positive regulatory protein